MPSSDEVAALRQLVATLELQLKQLHEEYELLRDERDSLSTSQEALIIALLEQFDNKVQNKNTLERLLHAAMLY